MDEYKLKRACDGVKDVFLGLSAITLDLIVFAVLFRFQENIHISFDLYWLPASAVVVFGIVEFIIGCIKGAAASKLFPAALITGAASYVLIPFFYSLAVAAGGFDYKTENLYSIIFSILTIVLLVAICLLILLGTRRVSEYLENKKEPRLGKTMLIICCSAVCTDLLLYIATLVSNSSLLADITSAAVFIPIGAVLWYLLCVMRCAKSHEFPPREEYKL